MSEQSMEDLILMESVGMDILDEAQKLKFSGSRAFNGVEVTDLERLRESLKEAESQKQIDVVINQTKNCIEVAEKVLSTQMVAIGVGSAIGSVAGGGGAAGVAGAATGVGLLALTRSIMMKKNKTQREKHIQQLKEILSSAQKKRSGRK